MALTDARNSGAGFVNRPEKSGKTPTFGRFVNRRARLTSSVDARLTQFLTLHHYK
nr:MAG TPA: hypothetical protein [Caudoviricetes sp.]